MENFCQCNNIPDILKIIIPSLITSVITLSSVFLVYYFGLKQFRKQKKLEFVERQLREFYSPLIGYKLLIRAINKNRDEIYKASDNVYKVLCKTNPNPTEKDNIPFDNSIKYDNKQLKEEVMPMYDKMISLIKDNNYLAEPETIKHFDELYKFVDIWHRNLDISISNDVVKELGHTEEKLQPFYDDLEKQQKKLTDKLSYNKK